jgi:hypothetical protein
MHHLGRPRDARPMEETGCSALRGWRAGSKVGSWQTLQEQALRSLVTERDGALRLQLLTFLEQHAVDLVQAGGRDAVVGLSRYVGPHPRTSHLWSGCFAPTEAGAASACSNP